MMLTHCYTDWQRGVRELKQGCLIVSRSDASPRLQKKVNHAFITSEAIVIGSPQASSRMMVQDTAALKSQ